MKMKGTGPCSHLAIQHQTKQQGLKQSNVETKEKNTNIVTSQKLTCLNFCSVISGAKIKPVSIILQQICQEGAKMQ